MLAGEPFPRPSSEKKETLNSLHGISLPYTFTTCTIVVCQQYEQVAYLAVTNEQQLDYNIICLVFITSTKDTIH